MTSATESGITPTREEIMSNADWTIARTKEDLDEVAAVRYGCLAEELGLPVADDGARRDLGPLDCLRRTHHVLVRSQGIPVGTVRILQSRGIPDAKGSPLGFELESQVDLGPLYSLHAQIGEVSRFCLLGRAHRTVAVRALFAGLYATGLQLGLGVLVGGVDSQTDQDDEASVMHASLRARGLVTDSLRVSPVGCNEASLICLGETAHRFYSAEELAGARIEPASARLASPIAVFARRLGARCIAPPVRHAAFPRFVVPMRVDLQAVPAATLAGFDPTELAPIPVTDPDKWTARPVKHAIERKAS